MIKPDHDIRPGATRLIEACGRPANSRLVDEICTIFRSGFDRQRAYPDTLTTLAELRQGYRLGLISNSSRAAFSHLNSLFGLAGQFDVIVPSYEVGAIKPDHRIFSQALKLAGVPPQRAIMVGDSPSDDYDGARQVGMAAILLDRRKRHPDHPHRITELAQLEGAIASFKFAKKHKCYNIAASNTAMIRQSMSESDHQSESSPKLDTATAPVLSPNATVQPFDSAGGPPKHFKVKRRRGHRGLVIGLVLAVIVALGATLGAYIYLGGKFPLAEMVLKSPTPAKTVIKTADLEEGLKSAEASQAELESSLNDAVTALNDKSGDLSE